MAIEIIKPMDIEKRSFEIITEKLNGRSFGEDKDDIVKRVIHTSADFDYRFWSRACNFRLGRVKHDVLNGVHIYTPCYDVNVNPVVLG